ncbi:hypothetical protein KIY81_gp53 [Mycobacterium phage Bugsy]|uniref:Uncharacterized protein n=1 Tax=Mycobacterium phage Bugsy TaxID=2656567 RepID=A0A649VFP0_9CAUD|nr:hypothetical protein KIY81_gp53 [Mycobacterium phage Bugsy]AMB18529.1 hypothetical protein NASIATALIE_39 [Mycobacterium phage NaSiaTalie]AYD86314.1 hypothetical protein SEA_FLARE16_39 [Mycobacterium phage Flare16]QGJ90563.1 hypothetical protein SEA_BUGSY_41 [Mycobacterium phage Bugsy]QXN74068.1 hypothetical protein SEA_MICULUCIGAS_39 [Mycobacterium Phage MiculUcigas]
MIDTDKQDHDFFDVLYQQWSQTTKAKSAYWIVKEDLDEHLQYQIIAVDSETQEETWLGSFHSEADADFVAGLNGAVPELIRRLHDAIDEATRKDEANDIAQGQLADALLENIGLRAEILELERQLEGGPR